MPGVKTDKKTDLVLERFYNRYNKFNIKVLKKLGATIAKFDGISPSEAHILAQELRYNSDIDKLINELSQLSGKSVKEIDKFFDYIAKDNVEFAEEYYKARNVEYVEYKEDTILHNYVDTIKEQTNGTFRNLSNSTNIGFSMKDDNGDMMFKPIKQVYNDLIDEAVFNVTTGVEDYGGAMRSTMNQLADSGVRIHQETVEYGSGYSMRIDSAVRQNVLDSVRAINREARMKIGEEIDADGVQLTAHFPCAIDHIDYQGRQYTKKEFEKIQASLGRPIGMWNCHHETFPIIMGVSKPMYTDEQLEEFEQQTLRTINYNGKKYNAYEATQIQRQLERNIRKQKDRQMLARASGQQEQAQIAQAKINQLTTEYNNFSKQAQLGTRKERLTVTGYRPIKVVNNIKSENLTNNNLKQQQLNIIKDTNPAPNDYNVWIRNINDIKTFSEVINDEESFQWGDYSKQDALKDLKKGNITIYSSKNIKNGDFVSTSKQQAVEYAGGDISKVISKKVPLTDVAWINGDEGQYAKIERNININKNNINNDPKKALKFVKTGNDTFILDNVEDYYLPKDVHTYYKEEISKLRTYNDFKKYFEKQNINIETDAKTLLGKDGDKEIQSVKNTLQKIATGIKSYKYIYGDDALNKLHTIKVYADDEESQAAYYYNKIGEHDPNAGTIKFRDFWPSGETIFHELGHALQDSLAAQNEDAVKFSARVIKENNLSGKAYWGARNEDMSAEILADMFKNAFVKGKDEDLEKVLKLLKYKK